MKFKQKLLFKLRKQQQIDQNETDFNLSELGGHMNLLLDLIDEKVNDLREFHRRKLEALGITDSIDSSFVNMSRNNIDKRETAKLADPIFNLSSRELNETEKRVLSKGLKFGIRPKRVDKLDILTKFEDFAQSFSWLSSEEKKNDPIRAKLDSKTNFYSQLQTMTDE